jgi:hypothetical protein
MRHQVADAPGAHVPDAFIRGLTIGVLVGAAIAGSRLWLRFALHRRRSA